MSDRDRLQDDAVWIEKTEHARARYISLIEMLRNWTRLGGLTQTPPFLRRDAAGRSGPRAGTSPAAVRC